MKRFFFIIVILLTYCDLFAQSNVVGVVKDESGEVLPGVFVYKKGTNKGVSTNSDGEFSIAATAKGSKQILVFQYLGMKTREISIDGPASLEIVMQNDNTLESSVVVGAYGSRQSREDLVGSAFQVNSDILKDKPKSRMDNLLEGLVPGLSIESNTDQATSTRTRYEMRVRGEASLSASNEPLWIIDGVIQYTGNNSNTMPGMSYTVSPLSYLDPSDIESITVLKDADQVSIYGANGANGVILVTTKSGSYDTPLRMSVNARFGVSAPDYSTMFKMMNAEQYMEVAREAWQNAGYAAGDFPLQDNDYNSYSTTSTDWAREYLGIGTDLYAQLSLSSGTKKTSNSLSASYYRNTNVVQSDNSQRFNIRLKETFKPFKGFTAGVGLQASYNINNLFPLGKSYLSTLPVYSPYENDGYTYRLYNKRWDAEKGDWVMKKFHDNDIPDRELNDNKQTTGLTKANINVDWEIVKGLSISSVVGISYQTSHEDVYYSRETLGGMSEDVKLGVSSRRDASYLSFTNSNVLRYSGKFGLNSVEVYGGLELNSQDNKYTYISGSGFTNDHIKELEYATTISQYSYSNVNQKRSMSYFLRGQYSYDQRYYISANFRRDGSSVFGKYSRWGTFWSVGTSWNIHKEKWFGCDRISMLKLKASIGSAGNSRIDGSVATGTYVYSSSNSYMGATGAVLGSMPNPDLSWETTLQFNVGARLELKNILAVELEYYNYNTRDLLSKVYVSRTISDDRMHANVGSIRNQGVELSLTTYNFSRRDFSWTTNFNASHNRNVITKLYKGLVTSFGDTVWQEGYSTDTYCLIRWAGVDPSDGSPMWYDKDGNLTKTYDYANRVTGRSSTPVVFGGMTNDIRWKNFTLSFQINYNIGGWAKGSYANLYMNDGYDISNGNQAVEVYYYRWTKPGQASLFPKVMETSQKATLYNDRFLYNKTHFNFKNLSLTYSLPDKAVHAMKMRTFDISFVCDNVYLLTPDQSRKFNSYKTVMNGYPVTRTFSLSLNIGL